MSTVNLIIKGKVQGVYYRTAAKNEAEKLGVTGWVKYISDGKVEIMATGDEEKINNFIQWCRKGPDKAEVSNVIITNLSDESFDEFVILQEGYPHDI